MIARIREITPNMTAFELSSEGGGLLTLSTTGGFQSFTYFSTASISGSVIDPSKSVISVAENFETSTALAYPVFVNLWLFLTHSCILGMSPFHLSITPTRLGPVMSLPNTWQLAHLLVKTAFPS